MRENEEDWDKQLNTVIIEIAGLNEIFIQDPRFLQLLSKLEGLNILNDIEFPIYRKLYLNVLVYYRRLKSNAKTSRKNGKVITLWFKY